LLFQTDRIRVVSFERDFVVFFCLMLFVTLSPI